MGDKNMSWILAEGGISKCVVMSDRADALSPAAEFVKYIGELANAQVDIRPLQPLLSTAVQVVIAPYDALEKTGWADAVAGLRNSGEESYLVKTMENNGVKTLLLSGRSMLATYYAVYDLLETLGVGFFFDEVVVRRTAQLVIEPVCRLEKPAAEVRCFKPQVLGDYSKLHSFWYWDQARWEQSLRWCVQNRLNTVHLMCFAGMNWIAYRKHPEARVANDPVMDTESRIRMAQGLIRYAHGLGLKVWVAFVTNGATYEYVKAHPDEACQGLGGVYQGDLCGCAGRKFLEDTGDDYFETYAEADGFVFWPPEGQCQCPDCRSGQSFLGLLQHYVAAVRRRDPGKSVFVIDWSLPAEGGKLPDDIKVLNMHEFSQLPPYIEKGHATVFDLIVNWDTASCTTVSPRVRDMQQEMQLTLGMGVKGFEGHLVSAFSGELNVQAFAAISWDPARFDADAFMARFIDGYYGQPLPGLKEVLAHLEAVWTPPFNAYTSSLVSRFHHWAVPEDSAANCIAESTTYTEQATANGPVLVKTHCRLPRRENLELLALAQDHLAKAHAAMGQIKLASDKLRFLAASVEAQLRYMQWLVEKYRLVIALSGAQDLAQQGDWEKARAEVAHGRRHLAEARAGILRLKEIMDTHPQWFTTRRCVSARDLETWIGTRAVDDEALQPYASSVIGGRCIPTAGLPTLEALVADAERAVAAKAVPRLKPQPEEIIPFIAYPLMKSRIEAVLRERLARSKVV